MFVQRAKNSRFVGQPNSISERLLLKYKPLDIRL